MVDSYAFRLPSAIFKLDFDIIVCQNDDSPIFALFRFSCNGNKIIQINTILIKLGIVITCREILFTQIMGGEILFNLIELSLANVSTPTTSQ